MAKAEATSRQPKIYEADAPLGVNGFVMRGVDEITFEQAIEIRRAGRDVVVCGNDLESNRSLAITIEVAAAGHYKLELPHRNAGPQALPHCQPARRPPAGHTFYETAGKKSKKMKS